MAKATEIKNITDIPAGTTALKRTITEVVNREEDEHTTFTSVDGEVYTFRTHFRKDGKKLPVPRRNELAIFIALREVGIGGSPFPVLDAFNLKIDDVDGKAFYPVPEVPSIEDSNENFTLGN